MNIYISNLSSNVTEQDLNDLFSPFGEVYSSKIQLDVFTGTSRGFGFVEMQDEAAAKNAIEKLDQSAYHGLQLTVKADIPKNIPQGSYKVGEGPVQVYKFRKS